MDGTKKIYYIINIFPEEGKYEGLRSTPEEANDKDLRSTEIRPKRKNAGTGIDQLFMYFYGKNCKSGKNY